jgi:hypothetical protein
MPIFSDIAAALRVCWEADPGEKGVSQGMFSIRSCRHLLEHHIPTLRVRLGRIEKSHAVLTFLHAVVIARSPVFTLRCSYVAK